MCGFFQKAKPKTCIFFLFALHFSIPYDLLRRENQDTLKFRISKLNLVVKRMPNDGNCQFSSISHQLYGTWKNHYEVRHAAVTQLIAHQDFYRKFVPVNYDVYCSEMQQNTIWGDNVTLQAISDYFGVHIKLVTSIRNCPFVEIVPHEKKLEKVLLLSYFRATHYNSLLTKQGKVSFIIFSH